MDFPNSRHAALQTGGAGSRARGVPYVEEERAFDLNGNGRRIKIVGHTRQVGAEEFLVGVPRRIQLRKSRAGLGRQARELHRYIHFRSSLRVSADDEMKIVIVLAAGGIEKGGGNTH